MSNQFALIEPTTSAVVSNPFPTDMYSMITVTTNGLGAGETINIEALVGSTPVQVLELDGSTAATLTSSLNGLILNGGLTYVFNKSATAAPCGLYINPQLK